MARSARKRLIKLLILFGLVFIIFLMVVLGAKPSIQLYFYFSNNGIRSFLQRLSNASGTVDLHMSSVDYTSFSWYNSSVKYSYDYEVLNSPRRHCSSTVRYLYMVTSSTVNTERRQTLRQTWVKDILHDASSQFIFVLGNPNNSTLQHGINLEREKHGDILQFNFSDTYRNASIKSVLILQYAAKCGPKFLVKADDDIFLNVHNLRRTVESTNALLKQPFILGHLYVGNRPVRDPHHPRFKKWYVSDEEYPDPVYPDYVSGHLYAIKGSVIKDMYTMALRTRPFPMEDAFITGALATKLRIPRIGHQLMGYDKETSDFCITEDRIAIHYVDSEQIRKFYSDVQLMTGRCSRFILWNLCWCVPRVNAISA